MLDKTTHRENDNHCWKWHVHQRKLDEYKPTENIWYQMWKFTRFVSLENNLCWLKFTKTEKKKSTRPENRNIWKSYEMV